jgi:hypothetical protein
MPKLSSYGVNFQAALNSGLDIEVDGDFTFGSGVADNPNTYLYGTGSITLASPGTVGLTLKRIKGMDGFTLKSKVFIPHNAALNSSPFTNNAVTSGFTTIRLTPALVDGVLNNLNVTVSNFSIGAL